MGNSDQESGLRIRRMMAKNDRVGLAPKGDKVDRAAKVGDSLDSSAMHHVVGFLIAMADVPARQVFSHHIGQPYELREVEFTLLVLLRANQVAAPKQLARSLNLPAPHVTLLLDRMAGRGLVERRRSPTDGRALQVHLTAKGETLAQRVYQVSQTMEVELLRALSPAERAMLRELLVKLAGAQA
jgi:DNA-binding MarR family transcriptional regulator